MPDMDDMLASFMDHFGIRQGESPRKLLGHIASAFSRLPYENITKIIKHSEAGSPEKARRYPAEVIRNHIDWGAGGTCFSLTSALLHLVRRLGFRAECVLADRRYGPDTHSALLIWIDAIPHLLDPGYLIVDPIPVTSVEKEMNLGFNRLILEPGGRSDRVSLSTIRKGVKTFRLTYKIDPVDPGEFFKAWDASFDWDMMHYPLLTRTAESGQIYLRGSRLQISDLDSVRAQEIGNDQLVAKISEAFQIEPALVVRALSILKQGG
jgi:arylamine N-acetyltransferase